MRKEICFGLLVLLIVVSLSSCTAIKKTYSVYLIVKTTNSDFGRVCMMVLRLRALNII